MVDIVISLDEYDIGILAANTLKYHFMENIYDKITKLENFVLIEIFTLLGHRVPSSRRRRC